MARGCFLLLLATTVRCSASSDSACDATSAVSSSLMQKDQIVQQVHSLIEFSGASTGTPDTGAIRVTLHAEGSGSEEATTSRPLEDDTLPGYSGHSRITKSSSALSSGASKLLAATAANDVSSDSNGQLVPDASVHKDVQNSPHLPELSTVATIAEPQQHMDALVHSSGSVDKTNLAATTEAHDAPESFFYRVMLALGVSD